MTSILEQLDQDHGNVASLLDVMEANNRCLQRGEHFDLKLLTSCMRYLTQYQDIFHHPREDLMFSKITVRAPGEAAEIAALESQHRLLASTGSDLYDALGVSRPEHPHETLTILLEEYTGLLREHMRREASGVFPLARIILSRTDWQDIDAKFEVLTDPLFGPHVEQSYRAVFERIGAQRTGGG